jgi:hypothetical protein
MKPFPLIERKLLETATKTRPCVRCLYEKITRNRAGHGRIFCIVQCGQCGFNVTAGNFSDAIAAWNGFKVWELVDMFTDPAKKAAEPEDFR